MRAVLLLALAACARTVMPPAGEASVSQEISRPRLLVFVVVDQLPTRLLDRLEPHLVGGLARLVGPGGWRAVAEHAHAVTQTCPGHATLSTGAAPSVHGIVSNAWIVGDQEIYCGDVALLTADTLADRVAANGGTVVAMSHKDRGALMLGGRSPRAVVTYDKAARTFTGATWAALDLSAMSSALWQPKHPEVYATFGPDDDAREGSPDGRTTFPHDVSKPGWFVYSAAAGTALTDVALAAMDAEGLGLDDVPDLLTISYSNTDYVGHAYGTESWEAADALVTLDQDLARLFTHLDQVVGAGAWTVALSSDHGSAPVDGQRLDPTPLLAAANAVLERRGIDGEIRDGEPFLVLPASLVGEARLEAAREIARDLAGLDGIAGAFASGDGVPPELPNADAIRLNLHPERSGDVFVLTLEGALFQPTGTNHGMPWAHDQRVPVLLWGAGIAPGRSPVVVDTRRIAPTLAALLGVPAPAQATEPVLTEALVGGK